MPANDIMIAGQHRWNLLEELIGQTQVDIMRYRNNNDLGNVAESLQILANARQEQNNLRQLHAEIVASETPLPGPLPETDQEKQAKGLDKMTWADSWDIANTSKHGCDHEGFKRGMQEVMLRRQRGE